MNSKVTKTLAAALILGGASIAYMPGAQADDFLKFEAGRIIRHELLGPRYRDYGYSRPYSYYERNYYGPGYSDPGYSYSFGRIPYHSYYERYAY